MTATAGHHRSDADLIVEIGQAFFGRVLPGGGVVWQREMSRATGISLSQLQAIATDRPLTAKSKRRLSEWVAKAREEERKNSARRYVLLRDFSKRVA